MLQQTILFCQGRQSWFARFGGLEGSMLCFSLFSVVLLQLMALQHFVDRIFSLGMLVRGIVVATVYGKAISLSRGARNHISRGKMVI